jgi:hypothetical protein
MTIVFPGDDPATILAKARSLADDLARILSGDGPAADDLAGAPLLDHWAPGVRLDPCLFGSISRHPVIGNARHGRTTGVFAIDADAGWARSWSRFYVLGRRASGDGRPQ